MRLNDLVVQNLKPKEKRYDVREGSGFCVRVMPSGLKTWLYIYQFEGKKFQMKLFKRGRGFPVIKTKQARDRFLHFYQILRSGKNPALLERESFRNRVKAPTVEVLCREYLERHAKRHKRSWHKDERMLNFDVIRAWGGRKAHDIQKRDVVLLLESIIERGSPSMANNTYQVIRKMYNWAVEVDLLKHSPCLGVKMPAPKVARDRVLSEDEIRKLWHFLDNGNASMFIETKLAMKLVLATAQRPGEVAGLHTDELDLDGSWWTIPQERSKNKKAHRVFLSDMARQIIEQAIKHAKLNREIPESEKYSGYVFPSPKRYNNRDAPMSPNALVYSLHRNRKAGKLDLDFVPHDLRRTSATFMAESGEPDAVIDAVLNHVKQGIIKIYNQYRYDKEKQIALEAWARRLQNILSGNAVADNVLPFRKVSE